MNKVFTGKSSLTSSVKNTFRLVHHISRTKKCSIQMVGEFLTGTVTMRWKIFQWTKFLFRHASNSRKLSRQKFHNEVACVFTAHCTSKNGDWNQQQLTDGGILANRNSANHRPPFTFCAFTKLTPQNQAS